MTELNGEIPEGYKTTELGVLPEEWTTALVRDVYEFSKKPNGLTIEPDTKICFIPMNLVSNDSREVTWEYKKYSEITSGTFVLRGDTLIAKITPSFENGKQAILRNLPDSFAYATTEVWALHPQDVRMVDSHLFEYIRLPRVRKELASKMEGSTGRQRLPRPVVENLLLPVPPVPEQKAIAQVLQSVQQAKEKTEEVIRATKEVKKSMMKHLFTYGPASPEEAEDVRLKETEIGMMPEEWEPVKVDIIFEFSKKPRGLLIPVASQIPFIPMEFVPSFGKLTKWDIRKVADISSGTFVLRDDLLIAKITPCFENGKQAILSNLSQGYAIATTEVWAVHPRNNRVINEHLFEYLKLPKVREELASKMEGTTGRKRLPRHVIEKLLIPLPPLNIQLKIAQLLSSLDAKIEAEENKRNALDALFKTLLSALMTAKIRVKH